LFQTKLNEASEAFHPSDPEAFKKLISLGKFTEAEKLLPSSNDQATQKILMKSLKMMKTDLDIAGNDVIDCQTDSLLFANEPYYSQATVVAVVAGIQMRKTGNEYPLLNDKGTHA